MLSKHFVTFYSPGTFLDENTILPINSWDVNKAKELAKTIKERHGATPYGFQFLTRSRREDELDSKITDTSVFYFLGGTIETRAEIEARKDSREEILVRNMISNKIDKVITNTNSWKITKPLNDSDIVLQWP